MALARNSPEHGEGGSRQGFNSSGEGQEGAAVLEVKPSGRPTPTEHYESLKVRPVLSDVRDVVLVDDVITRGHTFMACSWRSEEAYPGVRIHAFAAIRTVSDERDYRGLYDPVELGTITYRRECNDCLRRP